jgi:transketolase
MPSVRLLPELIGGSADLAGSNLTIWKGSKDVVKGGESANYVHYGVREFGMGAIANGLALHGGFRPYDATFLVFSDYARNAVRMSALIPTPTIHVYTHDSIGLGEDGPTHQPVEHLASLRYIPNNPVWRPCDAVESAVCWKAAIERVEGPSCLVFSRQTLVHQSRTNEQVQQIARGGYVLSDPDSTKIRCNPDRHRFGSGSGHAGHAHPRRQARGCARRIHALYPGVRCTADRVSRRRAPGLVPQAHCHRSGHHRFLAQVRWPRW